MLLSISAFAIILMAQSLFLFYGLVCEGTRSVSISFNYSTWTYDHSVSRATNFTSRTTHMSHML